MLVPGFVEEFHEAHASFHQPPRQHAVVRERGLAGLRAVHVEDVLRLSRDVHQFGRARLHAIGHLERIDPRLDLGVADFRETHAVQPPNGIQRVSLELAVHSRRVRQVQDGIAAGPELDSLVHRRQEAAAPVRVPAAGPLLPGTEDYESRQVARLAAQSVQGPRAHRRPAELLSARAHHHLGGSVVEGVRDEALDDRDLVDDRSCVRDQLGQFGAALAVLGELELRPEQRRVGVDERRSIAVQQALGGQRALVLAEFRLVVEELEVARAAAHEEEDDVLGRGLVVGSLRGQRIGRLHQVPQGYGAQAHAALLQEPAPR